MKTLRTLKHGESVMAITQADCARYAAAYQDAEHDLDMALDGVPPGHMLSGDLIPDALLAAEHAHAAYRISMAARAEYDRHA